MLLLRYILVTCCKNNIVTLHVTFMLYRRNKTCLLGNFIKIKSFFAIGLPLESAILNFEFWHQIRKQGSRKPESTKFHWIKSFVAFWFAIWNFQLDVISDFVVSNGVNGPNYSYCSNCPNCSNYSNCSNCSTVRTCFKQVRTGSNAGISNRTRTVRNISDPCTSLSIWAPPKVPPARSPCPRSSRSPSIPFRSPRSPSIPSKLPRSHSKPCRSVSSPWTSPRSLDSRSQRPRSSGSQSPCSRSESSELKRHRSQNSRSPQSHGLKKKSSQHKQGQVGW